MSHQDKSGRPSSHSATFQNAVSRVLRSTTRQSEKLGREAAKEEPAEGSRAAEMQEQREEPKGRTKNMEEEVWEKLATETVLQVEHIQEIWNYWRKERPNYVEFLKCIVPTVMTDSGTYNSIPACRVTITLWEKFQEVDKALKVPSTFSRLSLYDLGKIAGQHSWPASSHSLCSSSFAGVGPPLIFQDKGLEAMACDMCGRYLPAQPEDAIVETLFPKDDWLKVMSDAGTKTESKLKTVFTSHCEKALELANFVFVKPKKELCDPKIPDFALVDKDYWESPTADTVGALLFAQSTTEGSRNYSTPYAVGEAVAVAQILLRNASQIRHFIFTGVTNYRKIRWFRVERPGINGNYNGSQCAETQCVRESLAGMMCSTKENLGICLRRSIVVGQEEYCVQKWLGEGATSFVFAVDVGGVPCAAKVAKPGHSIFMDVSNLEKLHDIKGIPKIVVSDPPSVLVITPVWLESLTCRSCVKIRCTTVWGSWLKLWSVHIKEA